MPLKRKGFCDLNVSRYFSYRIHTLSIPNLETGAGNWKLETGNGHSNLEQPTGLHGQRSGRQVASSQAREPRSPLRFVPFRVELVVITTQQTVFCQNPCGEARVGVELLVLFEYEVPAASETPKLWCMCNTGTPPYRAAGAPTLPENCRLSRITSTVSHIS